MKEPVKNQIESNNSVNLLYSSAYKIFNIDRTFKNKLLSLKERNIEITSSLIEETVALLLEKVYAINQFVNIDPKGIDKLRALYRKTYLNTTNETFHSVMEEHHKCLAEIISSFYPKEFRDALRHVETIGSVKNEQYSVELQLQIFELSISRIKEPFLDIGCGSASAFVNYLLKNNIDAFGIDRIISSNTDRAKKIDWLEYNFSEKKWGMIYSNMGYSNHFIFNYRHGDQRIRKKYNDKYIEILEALKIGGEFIYAPSISFVEENIDHNKYSLIRKKLTGNISSTRIKKIAL